MRSGKISLNPDTVLKTMLGIMEEEKEKTRTREEKTK